MKTLEALGHRFFVAPMQKELACQGSSNSETVCFKLDRYSGETDLSECHCTIKTKNSEGKSDLTVPEVTAYDKKLTINWVPSSGTTVAAGPLQVQVQLEKVFDDKSKNINWQSNIMEFQITDSLTAADEIADQKPTLFQQWEEKVNTLYSDASADVQSMQALQSQVQVDADTVARQKQSVEQTAVQVTQDAQTTSGSAQNASDSAGAAQASATQAQTSVSDANTAQGLAKGYSDAAKTYSDASSVSAQSAQTCAQSAQQQADAAQKAVMKAQQKVDAFSGYTKEEIDNGFASVLIGEATGQFVTLDDVQPNTNLRSLLVAGQTTESGSGDKSPDNPYTLVGTRYIQAAGGKNLFQPQPGSITINGVACTVDGDGTITLNGTCSGGTTYFEVSPALSANKEAGEIPLAILTSGKQYTVNLTELSGSRSGGYFEYVLADMAGKQIVEAITFRTLTAGTAYSSKYVSSLAVGWIALYFTSDAVFSNYKFRIQLEQASSATPWEPFKGLQAAPLPQTLYGLPDGTADSYDAVSGQGTQKVGMIVLNGSENWGKPTCLDGTHHYFEYTVATGSNNKFNQLCSSIAKCSNPYSPTEQGASYDEDCFWTHSAHFRIRLASEPTLEDFKAVLAKNTIMICYEKGIPAAISSSARQIAAYAPVSILSADCGPIAAEYGRDLNKIIKKLENTVFAPVT